PGRRRPLAAHAAHPVVGQYAGLTRDIHRGHRKAGNRRAVEQATAEKRIGMLPGVINGNTAAHRENRDDGGTGPQLFAHGLFLLPTLEIVSPDDIRPRLIAAAAAAHKSEPEGRPLVWKNGGRRRPPGAKTGCAGLGRLRLENRLIACLTAARRSEMI